MLVLSGVVSAVAFAVAGAAVGAVVAVLGMTWAFLTGRLPVVGGWHRVAVAAAGTASATIGLVGVAPATDGGRSLVVVGVALLTIAAMLALVEARTDSA